MAIRANSIFKLSHRKLNHISKLLYVYLISHPQLTIVGVVQIEPDVACIELNIDKDQLRNATKELIESKLIDVKASKNNDIYYFVFGYYDSNAKGEETVKKGYNALKELPTDIVEWTGIKVDSRRVMFKEPSAKEITNFAMSIGYAVNGETVIEYYRRQALAHNKTGWVDSRGKQVVDWKSKIRKVWCKQDNKVNLNPNAPAGFEYFYIRYGDRIVTPDQWKNELPYSKEGIVVTEELRQAYEKQRNSV